MGRDEASHSAALSRRRIIQAAGLAPLLPIAGCARPRDGGPAMPDGDAATALVDVHCHVFNAADIPIRSFVSGVYLDEPREELLEPLIVLIATILETGAPHFRSEREALLAMRGGAAELATPPHDRQRLDRDRLIAALRRFWLTDDPGPTGSPPRALMPGPAPEYRRQKEQLLRRLREEAGGRPGGGPGSRELAPAARAGDAEEAIPAMAEGLLAGKGRLAHAVRWGLTYTRYRHEIAAELRSLYGRAGAEGVRFFAPALVDFEFWIEPDQAVATPIARQVELMALLSAVQPRGTALHGYVAFNPARQVRDLREGATPTALEVAQGAVRRSGFVGVKLYPAIGFRPLGNAGLGDDQFPSIARGRPGFGKELDAALRELYRWCQDEQVPILAHCSDSQSPRPGWGERASPDHWRTALAEFPGLRVDLGHFGGLQKRTAERAGWPATVVRLMADYPGVYADIADFDSVLGGDEGDAERLRRVTSFLRDNIAVCGPRTLFGTDWSLLGRRPGYGDFLVRWRERFEAEFPAGTWRAVARDNAIRFLGLAPGERTRERLDAFYAANGLDRGTLELFSPRAA